MNEKYDKKRAMRGVRARLKKMSGMFETHCGWDAEVALAREFRNKLAEYVSDQIQEAYSAGSHFGYELKDREIRNREERL